MTVSAGTLQWGSSNAFSGPLTVGASGIIDLHGYNTTVTSLSGSAGGVITDNAGSGTTTLTVSITSGTSTYAGVIQNGASRAIALTKSGSGTLDLSGSNTCSGTTTISGGTLQVGAGGTAGTLGSGGITDNATLAFNRSDTVTVTMAIGGTGGLTQQGSGTLVLSGTDTYSGTTTVSQGNLSVTGSISSSAVTVNSGATLSGTGTTGNVSISGGLSPGTNGVGTLNTHNLSFASGGSFNVDMTSSGWDQVNVTGTVSLGNASLNLNNSRTANDNGALMLIQNDGTDAVSGTFLNLPEGTAVTAGGVTYQITYRYDAATQQYGTGNDVALTSLPVAPADVAAAAASAGEIDLSWADNANETGYKIERSPDGSTNWTQIDTVGANVTTYSNTGLSEGTAYYYRVRATNTAGDSPYSTTVSASTWPATPGNLSLTSLTCSQVSVSWQDNSTQESGYSVEELVGSTWQEIGSLQPANSTTATIAGTFTSSTQYSFRVRAYQASDSQYSAAATLTVTSGAWPAAPTGLTATAVSGEEIDLSWADTSNETGYKIERSPDGSTNWTQIATVGQNVTSYQDTGRSELTSYYYQVRATNSGGDSPYSVSASDTTWLATPTDLSASNIGSTQCTLSWNDNSSQESGYDIEFSTDGTNFNPWTTAAADSTSYDVTGLIPQSDFWFRVKAADGGDESAASNVVEVTTAALADQPPTVATAAAASADPVTGTTVDLSVLGADDGGESNLTYDWNGTLLSGEATGPGFSANNSHATQDTTVTFHSSGFYRFVATITDAGGQSAYSTVYVTVDQTLTNIVVTPSTAPAIECGGTQQFTATGYDQFGHALLTEPTFTWNATAEYQGQAAGTIDDTGLYTAPSTNSTAWVTATSGSVTSYHSAIAIYNDPPTVDSVTATQDTDGPTAALWTVASDDAGDSNLTYTWTTISRPTGSTAHHLQRQWHQHCPEHDGHVRHLGELHVPGDRNRRGQSHGHRRRNSDRKPGAGEHHPHAVDAQRRGGPPAAVYGRGARRVRQRDDPTAPLHLEPPGGAD